MINLFYRTLLFTLVLVISTVICVNAQSREINGVVTDDFGAVIGATVIIDGTQIGTTTDLTGGYSITVNDDVAVLVFSFLGLETQRVSVGSRTEIDVKLVAANTQMEELIVVGYGVQKKSHLTGAITKFKTKEIENVSTSNVATALQGRLSGVSIQNYSGEVGVAPQISVRGGSTINGGGSPLIVVDNFVMDDGLSMVNASDIESIEVLKDASSSAIYGSRAANGVIMITTKQGSATKTRYSVNYSVGFKQPYELHELLDMGAYVNILENEHALGGIAVDENDLAAAWNESQVGGLTDWQKIGLQDNPMIHNVQFNLSGGASKAKYSITGGYISEDGLSKKNSVNKINFRSRLDIKLSDYVDLGTSISTVYTATERPTNNFQVFTITPSWLPVYHNEFTSGLTGEPIGSYAQPRHFNLNNYPIGEDGAMISAKPYNSSNNSPISFLDNTSKTYDRYQVAGNIYLNVKILPNLIFRTANSVNLVYSTADTFRASDANRTGDEAIGTFRGTLSSNLTTDNTLSYIETFGNHEINIMAGVAAEQSKSKVTSLEGKGYPTNYIPWLIAASSFNPDGTGVMLEPEENLFSYFGRFNYSLKDRYLFSAVFRADGYSLFGQNNKWGYFPSLSAGWRVSEEDFLKGNRTISSLKIRAGYGMTGDNNISPLATMDFLYGALYPIGGGTGTVTPGLANTSNLIANPDLGWARVEELSIGMDIGFFKNRLNVVLDYYYSITSDMLFLRPVSSISGHENYWTNQGKIRNKGVEVIIDSYNINRENFSWSTSFNIAFDKNRLLGLGGESQIIKTSNGTKESYVSIVGDKAIQFYGYKTDGVYLSQEDVDSSPNFAGNLDTPGGLKVVDTNGDGVLNTDDMTVIGDPYQDFTWGMTNTFQYKNFNLSFLLQGAQGGEMINGDAHNIPMKKLNTDYGIANRWVSESHIGDGKTPSYSSKGINWLLTDYVVEDASYVALRNVTIGYTLPNKVVKKLRLGDVKVFVTADNVLFFTPDGYRGINSEYRSTTGDYADPLISGYQRGGFPIASTISAGIEVKF